MAGLRGSSSSFKVVPQVITKLLSGAQTGADRAALDWASFHDIPHGGWCPKGRKAEDGTIPSHYQLTETPSASYLQRTEWNVRDSDGTVIFTMAAKLAGGSKRTAEFAKKHGKPLLHISCGGGYERPRIHTATPTSLGTTRLTDYPRRRGTSRNPVAC